MVGGRAAAHRNRRREAWAQTWWTVRPHVAKQFVTLEKFVDSQVGGGAPANGVRKPQSGDEQYAVMLRWVQATGGTFAAKSPNPQPPSSKGGRHGR